MKVGVFCLALFAVGVNASSRWMHRCRIAQRIALKAFYRLAGNRNLRWQPASFFGIKKGYHHAVSAEAFDDTPNKDEWQQEVYELANQLGLLQRYSSVIDVGCGSGYKLVHTLGNYATTGIELQPAWEWLRQQYPDREWLLFDTINPQELRADMVVCSDVIEHMENPDDLLDFLSEISFQRLIISTPERDGMAGKTDFGPPENTSHYREWNATEFKKYLERWFIAEEQRIFNSKSVTQVVICQKKQAV